MVEQHYLAQGLAHSDDLSAAATSQQASVYPDLTSFGTVSTTPFTYPSQYDSNLLTPSSTAGSPPLHQARKFVGQYPPPPTPPGTQQQPTPPGSTKMYAQQWSQFDMEGQSSQTGSPMPVPAPVAPEYMEHPYLNDGRRTPNPPVPYMGAFGVSEGPEQSTMNPPYYMNMPPPMDQQQQHHHQMSMGMHHRGIPSEPLMSDSNISQFRPRQPTPEDQPIHGLSDGSRSINGSPRRRTISTASSSRVSKKRPAKSRGGSHRASAVDDPLEEHKNCFGQEVPPSLKPNCPDEERCIFESRWKHRHQKGQDMWESIQSDFKNRFHKCPGKEMLQMKFKRGRSKYIDWIPKDEDLLREAWVRVEKARYQAILDTFIELGGSRNMRLNPSDIEVKVVSDLKLEEGIYMESHSDVNVRRRRKSASTRRRTNARGDEEGLPTDEMMSVSSHNTHEDEVINQVHGRLDYSDDMSGRGNEMMDMQMWAPEPAIKMEPGTMPVRNENMAQMMRVSPSAAAAAAAAAAAYGRHR